jgi:hypothetical protein
VRKELLTIFISAWFVGACNGKSAGVPVPGEDRSAANTLGSLPTYDPVLDLPVDRDHAHRNVSMSVIAFLWVIISIQQAEHTEECTA